MELLKEVQNMVYQPYKVVPVVWFLKLSVPISLKKQDKITHFVLHLFVKNLSLLTTSVNN